MAVERLSISVTRELAAALRLLAHERGEDVSRLVEILVRESGIARAAIERVRAEGPPPARKLPGKARPTARATARASLQG